jgi:hypothetical protein
MFGLLGALIGAAFGPFQCKKCGVIPRNEFSPEVQKQMTVGSITLIGVAVAVLAAVIVLAVVVIVLRTK